MAQKKKEALELVRELERGHDETFQKTNQFYNLLIHLRYEGKASLGKNIHEAGEVLNFFKGQHSEHMELEEDVIFPFLKTHVPKLEPVIHLLHAEHQDFKRNLKTFEHLLEELVKEKYDLNSQYILEKIRDTGTYLIYLLRSHNQSESDSVYKVIDQELHTDEKRELCNQIENFH